MSGPPLANEAGSVYTSVVTRSKAERMTTSPRSIGRWVLGICALAGALLPTASASALSYPPSPSEEPVSGGSFFTVTVECVVPDTVVFTFNGVTLTDECTELSNGASVQTAAILGIAQGRVRTTAVLGIAQVRFRAPSPRTTTVYVLTIVVGGVTYTRDVVVEAKPGGGGGGGGGGIGGGGGRIPGGIGTSGGLPRTGNGSLEMLLTSGVAAVVTGAGVFAVAKRRSRQRLVA